MANIDRRTFLKLTAVGAASLAVPWSLGAKCDPFVGVRFFSPAERAALEAVAARIVPSDIDAGAREAGAVRYIEVMLAAFDFDPPWIFAGGPFSGRTPFPAARYGAPSSSYPDDAFAASLPLSRTREIAWRMRLDGSADVRGGAFNDAARGSTAGLRDSYRDGLAALDALARGQFGAPFMELRSTAQDAVLADADANFVRLITEHTLEGMYAAPEYGGNQHLVAWQSIAYGGDSQPLGYSLFNSTTSSYNEIARTPVSTANPNEVAGFGDETLVFISAIVAGAGGRRFF
jgi:gluconate 2-dehydrogenase gamma chain